MREDIRLGQLLRRARQGFVDGLLPPLCLSCDRPLRDQGLLCAVCWRSVAFISQPACVTCGLPFDFDPGPDSLCLGCMTNAPSYQRARAVMRYDGTGRKLLLSFKHGDRTEAAASFAIWMRRAGADLLQDADLMAVVPLHWTRLLYRRYNQAALLGRELVKGQPQITYCPELLRRKRATPVQGHLNRSARARNVAGAFDISPKHRALLSGKRVLLLDDVMTTGATLEACCKTLLRAGAKAVDALVLARVTRE